MFITGIYMSEKFTEKRVVKFIIERQNCIIFKDMRKNDIFLKPKIFQIFKPQLRV